MRRGDKTGGKGTVIALALTWDGARWPVRSLPPKACAFLQFKGNKSRGEMPSARTAAELFAKDEVREIRICWVPLLKGGDAVLSGPFPTATRIGFQSVRTVRFGDVLGVVYRRG